jgi:hypothetical protein
MGQYGNQPDFGTIATMLSEIEGPFPPSAIYVGKTNGNGVLRAQVVGNEQGMDTIISGIPSCTILPFIVTEIRGEPSGINREDIVLYR